MNTKSNDIKHVKVKYYYDKELARLLADKILKQYKNFNSEEFISNIAELVEDLELKERIGIFAQNLRQYLPAQYNRAVSILLKILGPENKNETGMFTEGYWLMPVAYFVEKYGIDDFKCSVNAICEITKRHTGEYAVRPFLEKYPSEMLAVMKKWSKDENFHVRRLSSEGVRPRLPWAKKLRLFIDDPDLILPILENLKMDKSNFVRKSVANCINDILKDNRDTAMALLKKWSKLDNQGTKWIIKHALRNEIKKENPEALRLIRQL